MDGAATSSGEKKSKSRREAEGRDLLLVRHAVPKINSLEGGELFRSLLKN